MCGLCCESLVAAEWVCAVVKSWYLRQFLKARSCFCSPELSRWNSGAAETTLLWEVRMFAADCCVLHVLTYVIFKMVLWSRGFRHSHKWEGRDRGAQPKASGKLRRSGGQQPVCHQGPGAVADSLLINSVWLTRFPFLSWKHQVDQDKLCLLKSSVKFRSKPRGGMIS